MDTEIKLRKKAIRLWLQGRSKSEIAQHLQKPRLWVQRWTRRYDPNEPEESLQNRSSAPKHPQCGYAGRIKEIVLQSRRKREASKRGKYRHALIGAAAIHYELRELGINPYPSIRTIHVWLKQAGMVKERKAKAGNRPTQHIRSRYAKRSMMTINWI
jgi:transposase